MTTNPDARQAFIDGLRSLADFLAANPIVPVPRYGHEITLHTSGSDADNRRTVEEFAAITGAALTDEVHYRASRSFGPVAYQAVAIPAAAMDAHRALMSYDGSVTPGADQREAA
jgi:hypothetical protein